MSPYPAAWCELVNANDEAVALKVYAVSREYVQHGKAVGTIVTDGKNYIKVAVKDGYVSLDEVQLAGKKRMPVADLLRGFSIEGAKCIK
jgi:methionyl-tRNA formyltransferase